MLFLIIFIVKDLHLYLYDVATKTNKAALVYDTFVQGFLCHQVS